MSRTRTASDDIELGWHALPPETVAAHFAADCQSGLDGEAIGRLRARYGDNVVPEPPRRPLWLRFARQLKTPAMNEWFHTVALPLETLLVLAALASVVLWAEEARKLLQKIGRAPVPA